MPNRKLRTISHLTVVLLVLATMAGSPQAQKGPPSGAPSGLHATQPPEGRLDPGYVYLRGMKFRPGVDEPPSFAAELAGQTNPVNPYFLVRFDGPLGEDQVRGLQGAGAKVLDTIKFYTQVVRIGSASIADLRSLPSVVWVGPWAAGMKADPALLASIEEHSTAPDEPVHLLVHPQRDRTAVELLPHLERLTRGRDAVWTIPETEVDGTGFLRVTIGKAAQARGIVLALARVPQVFSISRWSRPELSNAWNRIYVQGGIPPFVLQQSESVDYTGVPWRQLPGPGDSPQPGDTSIAMYPIHARGLQGQGQCVAVEDTGLARLDFFEPFDNCSVGTTCSPDWNKKVTCHFRATDVTTCQDQGGACRFHGTHVAGTVAGDLNLHPDGGYDFGDGIAPRAKLIMQDNGFLDAAALCDLDTAPLTGLRETRVEGVDSAGKLWECRIHSDSWGNKTATYDGDSITFDSAIWDSSLAAGLQQDWLAVVAAGNDGPGIATVGQPATAKNVLTVGAADPGYGGQVNILEFSSEGPTLDGRLKPDVVSTGCAVSACGDNDAANCSSFDGFVDRQGTKQFCGTSMATPTVSGATALVRQYYREGWYPCGQKGCASAEFTQPSAALLKATVINGTWVPDGAHYGDGTPATDLMVPNSRVGFGWVNLENSLYFDGDRLEVNVLADLPSTSGAAGPGLEAFEGHGYTLPVSGAEPLRLTLVWTDPEGTSTGLALVNDLNLRVTAPDGTVYHGNTWVVPPVGSPYWLSRPLATTWDNVNNVEGFYLPNPAPGSWSVEVLGANVPGRAGACNAPCSQGYALVASGRFAADAAAAAAGQLLATAYGISGGCDGDAFLDNGERATLQIRVKNFGAGTATIPAITPTVAADSVLPAGSVLITPPSVILGALGPGAEQVATFQIRFLEQPTSFMGEYLKLRVSYGWNLGAGGAHEFISIPLQTTPRVLPYFDENFEGVTPPAIPAGWTSLRSVTSNLPGPPPRVVTCDTAGGRLTPGQELKFGANDCTSTMPSFRFQRATSFDIFLLGNQMTGLSYYHRVDSANGKSGLEIDPDGVSGTNFAPLPATVIRAQDRPWDLYRTDLRGLEKINGVSFGFSFFHQSFSLNSSSQGSLFDDLHMETLDPDVPEAGSPPPNLTLPISFAPAVSVRPDLGWDHVADRGGRMYTAHVCSDSNCTSVVWSQAGILANQVTVSPSLDSLAFHYWQVKTADNCAIGDFSSIRVFRTAQADFVNSVPGSIFQLLPGTSENRTVTLDWLNGYDEDIALSCTGLPAGTTCSYSGGNPAVWNPSLTTQTRTLKLIVGAATPLGDYSIQIVASGTIDGVIETRSQTRTLRVHGSPGDLSSLLRVSMAAGNLDFSWGVAGCDVQNYGVFAGDLDVLQNGQYNHDHRLTCSTGGVSTYSRPLETIHAGFNFDSKTLQGWTPTSMGCASNLWLADAGCIGNSWGMYFGVPGTQCTYDLEARTCGAVVSPAINLAGTSVATLMFDYRLETDRTNGRDIATVEAAKVGSGDWGVLADNQASGAGGLIDDNAWHTATIPLDTFAGLNTEIRFTFDSVTAKENKLLGFAVDNVVVRDLPENLYVLIVPNNLTFEGSYGHDSTGAERPVPARSCRSTQNATSCP